MFRNMKMNPSPKFRAWLYGVAVAAFGVTGFYGITSQDEAAVWLGFIGSALNGLALLNVDSSTDELDEVDDDA